MMVLMNGMERTLAQYDHLFSQTGWKTVRVYRSKGPSIHQQIQAVAV